MTSAINCPLWSSVYQCQRVECAFTSTVRTECGILVMCCMMQEYNSITAFTQVCRKRRLKGGLEPKLMLLFCVGIVHTHLYNCIS